MPAHARHDGPRMTRRRLIAMAGATGLTALAADSVAAVAALLPATPRQSAGPFYTSLKPLSVDNDLVRVAGRADPAAGRVLHVTGRVLDTAGQPVGGARVEIWQANSYGDYHHPGTQNPSDPNFQGIGHDTTNKSGAYRFRTVKPGGYGAFLWARTPHIHFAVFIPGRERWTTQMYFAGEASNDRDSLLGRIGAVERPRVVRPLGPPAAGMEPDSRRVVFDLVIGMG